MTVSEQRSASVSRHSKLWVLWGVALMFVFFSVSGILKARMVYAPFTLTKYELLPTAVCPLGEVRSFIESYRQKPLLGSIAVISNTWRWKDVEGDDGGGDVFANEFDGIYGKMSGESSFIRFAPNEPGSWHVEANFTITGYKWLNLGEQQLPTVVTEAITVLPHEDERCLIDDGA